MALKPTLKTLEGLEPEIAALYTEDDDGFVLAVDGMAPVAKLEEFRGNNRELFTANKALADELAGLKGKVTELESAAHEGAKKGEEAKTLSQRLAALEESNAQKDQQLAEGAAKHRTATFRDTLKAAGLANGVNPKAIDDWADASMSQWKVNDDGTGQRLVDGNPVMSPDRPGQFQSPAEFAIELSETKPFYYASSGGDGANPASSGGKLKIAWNDDKALGLHAEKIRSGEVEVEPHPGFAGTTLGG